jgi:protein-S-isoprenylcysteine O-methyltransferase Ste14
MDSAEAANVGIARPPWVYLGAIALGLAIDFLWPIALLPQGVSPHFGALVVLLAVGLFVCAVRMFRAAGTPVPGHQPTTAIVRAGPYRFSRNPIYVAFTLLQLGIAIWANSAWLLATLVVAALLMHCVVIRREEEYLERKFGVQYLEYKATVRRWL